MYGLSKKEMLNLENVISPKCVDNIIGLNLLAQVCISAWWHFFSSDGSLILYKKLQLTEPSSSKGYFVAFNRSCNIRLSRQWLVRNDDVRAWEGRKNPMTWIFITWWSSFDIMVDFCMHDTCNGTQPWISWWSWLYFSTLFSCAYTVGFWRAWVSQWHLWALFWDQYSGSCSYQYYTSMCHLKRRSWRSFNTLCLGVFTTRMSSPTRVYMVACCRRNYA